MATHKLKIARLLLLSLVILVATFSSFVAVGLYSFVAVGLYNDKLLLVLSANREYSLRVKTRRYR